MVLLLFLLLAQLSMQQLHQERLARLNIADCVDRSQRLSSRLKVNGIGKQQPWLACRKLRRSSVDLQLALLPCAWRHPCFDGLRDKWHIACDAVDHLVQHWLQFAQRAEEAPIHGSRREAH